MSVSIVLVRSLVEAVNRLGVDLDHFFASAGLERNLLDDPELRLELSEYDRLQEVALELTHDPALGLHMGEHASGSTFGVLGQLAASSRNLRDAIEALIKYYPLVMDFTPPELRVTAGQATLVYPFRHSKPELSRLCAEFGITRFASFGKQFAGPAASLMQVWFEHARPAYGTEYTRLLGENVHFGMSVTGLVFPALLLDVPNFHWDPELHQLLKVQADRALHRVDSQGVADRIRALLSSTESWARPEMSQMARMLGITERGLRRRLAAEGVCFRDLLDEVQRERALLLARNPTHSQDAIAVALGFSEVSAFHRAFKRWTGMTPVQYRTHGAGTHPSIRP